MAITTVDIGNIAGLQQYQNTDLAEVKAGIKASSCVIHSIDIDNPNGAEVFLKLWNVAVGSVTVGTTAVTTVIMVPATTRLVIPLPGGWTFGTALTAACVLNAVESDATDPGASAVVLKLLYV